MEANPEAGNGIAGVGLRRELGLVDAVGVGFGAIVGAGIFVVTGVAAGIAGPALLLGLGLAAVAATCNALSSAQLAAEYPQAGATYEYGYRLLGPWYGFTAGWMFLTSKIAAAGTVALGLAGYVDGLVPGLEPRAIAVGAIVLFTALNYLGIRRSSRVNLVIVAVSLGTLLLFAILGAPEFDSGRLRPFAPHGWRSVLEAGAVLFFAFTGYARIATLAEEVHEPRRTIPRAIVITIVGAVVIYAAVALVAVGTVGADGMAETAAPLQRAALTFRYPWAATMVSIGALTAMLGVVLSQLLGLSRMGFAMARRGDLPRFLGHVHPEYGVPDRAVLTIGAIAAVVALTGSLRGIASAASFAILVYYLIANLAALRVRREAKLFSDAVPAVGFVACAILALSLSPTVIGVGLAILATGLLYRLGLLRLRNGGAR